MSSTLHDTLNLGLLDEAIDRMRELALLTFFEPLFMKWIFDYYARVILCEDRKASPAAPSTLCHLAYHISYYHASFEWMEQSLRPFLARIDCKSVVLP